MKKNEIIKKLREKSYGGQFIGNVIEALYGDKAAIKFKREDDIHYKRLWQKAERNTN